MRFLFPAHPLNSTRPEDFFAAEYSAIKAVGYDSSLISFERLQAGALSACPTFAEDLIIYRGWMLSKRDYESLYQNCLALGATLLTDPQAYLAAHHLPNWFPLLSEFTPDTRIFDLTEDISAGLSQLNWPGYFVKDFVKSLKTAGGSRISSPDKIPSLIEEMKKFRGVVEGGICVRRIEDFLPQTEQRFFVLDSIPYGIGPEVPAMVKEAASRIRSRFFSIDLVTRRDGVQRIVEIGDGQVSEPVGWPPDRFASMFKEHFGRTISI